MDIHFRPSVVSVSFPRGNADEEEKTKELVKHGNSNIYSPLDITWKIDKFDEVVLQGLFVSNALSARGLSWMIFVEIGLRSVNLGIFLTDTGSIYLSDSIYIEASVGIYNPLKNTVHCEKGSVFQVSGRKPEAKFFNIMDNDVLFNRSNGFLLDNSLTVLVLVKRCRVDFKYVGLINQGATGYLNSMLQMLYHIPSFRKAIYQIPAHERLPSLTITFALQIVFCLLYNSSTSVSTKLLTDALGWDSTHVMIQQDVQEFYTKFCENLEKQMEGSIAEGTTRRLFEGSLFNYIECMSVDDQSVRKNSFYDLQIDIKGCKDVYASLDKFFQAEILDGENKYHSAKYGFQQARKGVLFNDLPPILQLHLKRFEYDTTTGTMEKIYERFEYPIELDLDKDDGKYLSPFADRSKPNLYSLYSVVVHSGESSGGHYYTFIRPLLGDQWYKFNDEVVAKEKPETVLEEHYGGDKIVSNDFGGTITFPRSASAYMLVYIRVADKDEIMCKIDDDLTEELKRNLKRKVEGLIPRDKDENKAASKIKLEHPKDADKGQIDKQNQDNIAGEKEQFQRTSKAFISCGLVQRLATTINVDFEDPFVIQIEKRILRSEPKSLLAEVGIPVPFQELCVLPMSDDNKIDFGRPLIKGEIQYTVGELSKYSSSDKITMDLSIFMRLRDLLVELSNKHADLRILHISNHQILKVLDSHENIYYMCNKGLEYRAEEIPDDERKADWTSCRIHINHPKKMAVELVFGGKSAFPRSESRVPELFGEHFLLLIRADEVLSQRKIHIKNKLQLPDDEFDDVAVDKHFSQAVLASYNSYHV